MDDHFPAVATVVVAQGFPPRQRRAAQATAETLQHWLTVWWDYLDSAFGRHVTIHFLPEGTQQATAWEAGDGIHINIQLADEAFTSKAGEIATHAMSLVMSALAEMDDYRRNPPKNVFIEATPDAQLSEARYEPSFDLLGDDEMVMWSKTGATEYAFGNALAFDRWIDNRLEGVAETVDHSGNERILQLHD